MIHLIILICYKVSILIIIIILQWSSGHLINLGWSNNEEILCCQDDGLVLIYDLFGNYQHTFSMMKVVYITFITSNILIKY